MRNIIIRSGAALVALALFAARAEAATTFVGLVQTYGCAAHQWASSLASGSGATSCTQPAVGDLASVNGGTVLGNNGSTSAVPAATAPPVLGIAAATAGTLGLANGGGSGAVVTLQNPGATTAYNFNLPAAAGSAGQVLTSQGGGSTAMTWSNVVGAAFTVTTKTAAYTVTSADDWKRFDNAGAAGAVTLTLPASPSAGDNWCFLVAAAQTFEVLANTGETLTLGNTTGAAAGNLQANTVGSSVCLYFESATAAYAWASNGNWQLN